MPDYLIEGAIWEWLN